MEKEVLFSQIIDVKPYRVSKLRIFALTATLIIIGVLFAQINLVLSIAFPLCILIALLSLICHNISFCFSLIFMRVNWQEAFSYVTVQTKIQQQQKHCKVFKPLLKPIHRINQQDFLFTLRGKIYSCNCQRVKEINDADRLKMIGVDNLDKYSKIGLQGQAYTKSITLFGKQEDLFEPSIFKILYRFYWEQTGWIFACLLTLIVGIQLNKKNTILILLHLAIHTLAFLVVFIQICLRKYHFHTHYGKLSQKAYDIIRQGKEIKVKLCDLLIGDIVKVKFQKQQEQTILFKGVLLSNQDIQIKQGKEGKQAFKKPLKDYRHLEQLKRRQRHTLYSGTRIINSFKQEFVSILVIDRTLSNNFKIWFEKPHQQQYESISKRIEFQKIKLLLAGSGLLIGFYSLNCLILGKGLFQATKSLNYSLFCAIFPVLFIANQLVLLITTLRMKHNQIILFQSDLQKVSFCPKIFIDDFKRQLKFTFSELLYKNKIFKYKNEEFKPNLEAMRAASTEDSQLALIIYISLGKFQKQFSFLQKTFQKFQQQFQYDISQSQTLVIHKSSNKKWTVEKLYPLDQKGIRSWLLQFDNRVTYLISELNQVNDSIFNLLRNQGENRKKESYAQEAKLKIDQGKQIKAMFYRNFKDQQMRGSTAPEINFNQEPRENLQMKYQFGTFLIFDNSLPESTSEAINKIIKFSNKIQKLIEPILLTQEGKETLQGLEHHLQGVPILHNCSAKNKEKQIKQSISKNGTIFIGNTDHNYQFHFIVDFAGQLTKQQNKINFPTDVLMKTVNHIPELLSYSRWILQSTNENVKLGFFFVFFQLTGEIYILNITIEKDLGEIQQLKVITNLVCFIILASILRQLVGTRPTANKHMKNITLFSPNLYISFIFIICLGIIWVVFGFKEILCHYITGSSFSAQSSQCVDLDQFLGGWAALLFYCIFYNEQSWIVREDWGRLLIMPIWLFFLYLNNVGLIVCLGVLIGLLLIMGLKNGWRNLRKCF